MRQEFSSLALVDRARAEASLSRIEQRLATALFVPLASLLAHSPDPDSALGLLERYAEISPAEVLNEISHYPSH